MISKLFFVFVFVFIIGSMWFFRDQSDLKKFDPLTLARYETESWKAYYSHRWLPLGYYLYLISRDEYRFSPWNSLRLGFHSTQAARVFRMKGDVERNQIISYLTDYYAIIASHSPLKMNAEKCASLEYDWWQMRREKSSSEAIAEKIASLLSEIYQKPIELFHEPALSRVKMMTFRDERRNQVIQPEEWRHIQEGLTQAYQQLQEKIKE